MTSGRTVAKSRWSRYVAFWNERESPEALALVRITFGLCLVANVLEQLLNGDVLELYANVSFGGIFPYVPRSPWTLFRWIAPTSSAVYGLVFTQLIAAGLLTVGLVTRPAAVVCLVIQMTFWDRTSLFRFDADNVFRVFLYLMALAPAGAAWSVDARWRGKGRAEIPRWPRRLIIAQLTLLYLRTGVIKLGSTWSVVDGWSALYYSVNLPGLARWPGEWAAYVFPLTQVATFIAKWFEITFFLVPLSLYLRRGLEAAGEANVRGGARRALGGPGLRRAYIAIGVMLHGGLVILMNLGMFPFVMLSLYPSLLTPLEARRIVLALSRESR